MRNPRDGHGIRNMSDTYIIEVSSEAAGIVVREKSGFRFFAAVHKFNPLDGRVFKKFIHEQLHCQSLFPSARSDSAVDLNVN